MKPSVKYGILDDFGEVIRWTWSKPAKQYKFVTQKRINLDNFAECLV